MSVRLLLHFLVLGCTQIAWTQTTLFEENFNDCALSDQWTVSLEGNQNVRWAVGIPTNPKSDSSTIDGSCMLYIDDDLTGDKTAAYVLRFSSSWFQTNNYTAINLAAQVHFRRDGEEVFRIYADDGSKLHLIREYKGKNYSGTKFSDFVNVSADLSFVASDSLRLVIEFDDKNNWGWWAAIDNIKVTASGEGGEIIMGETFNDCTLPQGWSTEILTGVDDWKTGLFTDGKSIDGSCFLFFNDDVLGKDAPLSKHRIYTPFFDADVYERYILTYDFIFRFYEKNEYFQLYVDDGSTWTPVKTYSADFGGPNVDQSMQDTIELSAFKSKKMRLIWEYNDGGWAWWLGMDNVKITALGRINDRCAKAIDISQASYCTEFNNQFALPDDEWQNQENAYGYLYYSFTPTVSNLYSITTKSYFNDVVQLAKGTCESFELIGSQNRDEYGFEGEKLNVQLESGKQYLIRVAGKQAEFGLSSGSGCIRVTPTLPLQNPPFDICSQAQTLEESLECQLTNNRNANTENVLPATNLRSRADIWYKFTPTSSDVYTFTTRSNFAETIALYTGDCSQPVELTSRFEGGSLEYSLEEGTTYFIQITSFFATLEGEVCLQVKAAQNNQQTSVSCQNSLGLIINGQCTSVNNDGRPFSGKRPPCEFYIDSDVWFSFKATQSGLAYVRVKADFEYLAALYSGNCGDLKPLFCDRELHYCNGYLFFDHLTPNTIYYLQVASKKTQTGYKRGEICVEVKDQKPDFTPLSVNATQECIGHGAVMISPYGVGGKAPYTYYGLGIENAVRSGEQILIEITDADGCVVASPFTTQNCDSIACSLNSYVTTKAPLCAGQENGSAQIEGEGGLPPYQFVWSTGANGASINSLSAGEYTVTMTDEGGCEITSSITIDSVAPLTRETMLHDVNCPGGADGSISIDAKGGTPPYAYLWSNGKTVTELTDLEYGAYQLTISDSNGCLSYYDFIINEPLPWWLPTDSTQLIITNSENGYIGLSIYGATPPYQFLWYKDELPTDFEELLLSTSIPGNYKLLVTDANGCTYESDSWLIQNISITLEQFQNDIFAVYPNPVIDKLRLETINHESIEEIYVTNAAGKVLKVPFTKMENGKYEFSVSELPSGVYFIHCKLDKRWFHPKWIKIN